MDEDWDDEEGNMQVEEEEDWRLPEPNKRDPNRIFCPRCTTIWRTWEDKHERKLKLKCDNCGHMEDAPVGEPVYENYIVKQEQDILSAISPYTGQDRTLHQDEGKDCPNCGHQEAVTFQADVGAKVESLKLAYVCKNCGHSWLESGDI